MQGFAMLVVIVLFIALIGIGPIITIWSLNTLFGLNIAYSIWTWLATLWLGSFLTGWKRSK